MNPSSAASDEKKTESTVEREETNDVVSTKPSAEAPDTKTKLQGSDIAGMLSSEGPTVKCVILRHMRADGKDTKPHAHVDSTDSKLPAKTDEKQQRPVLEELVEEIQVDTTPSRNHVKEILGGDFTFLGQYSSEGTVVMARKDLTSGLPSDLATQSLSDLRQFCRELQIDISTMVEKSELVAALQEKQSQALPLNPHYLQPPLHKTTARGDILLMKVAETKEELDDEDNDEEGEGPAPELELMSNEEFFLDYTKEEYIKFASRTDIEETEVISAEEEEEESEEADHDAGEEHDDEENGNGDSDDEEDEDFDPEEIGDLDRTGMMNIILSGVIQKFRESNGRGPNTEELLNLRSAIAGELGIDLDALAKDQEEDDGKKRDEPDTKPATPGRLAKRVKFEAEKEEAQTQATTNENTKENSKVDS